MTYGPLQLGLDQGFMQRALDLATQSTGLASPNPLVGCIVVRNEIVLGEGSHFYDLRDHAEITALKRAVAQGHSAKGTTAYVTLEPCAHQGRTGPCADALIAAGIVRVVIATIDPNAQVSGQGVARLRAAGIEVTVGVLQQSARDLNDAFARFIQHRLPFVTLKAALSVDGKLAPPQGDRLPGQPHWLTGTAARAEVQRMRHASDAILTGIGTVLADDPALTERTGLARRRPLLRVILDTHLRTPLTAKLLKSASENKGDLLIFTSAEASIVRRSALEASGAEVVTIPMKNGQLSLSAVLKELAERKILSVLLEAGFHLNGAFLNQDLVDKVVLFYSATELGDAALPFAEGVPSPYLLEQSLERTTRSTFDSGDQQDACVTGYLHDPWPVSL